MCCTIHNEIMLYDKEKANPLAKAVYSCNATVLFFYQKLLIENPFKLIHLSVCL